ncbi:MAG: OsmC family protein [Zhengella sp.]|uniref:OsmC family protein n=1 Tax=Zhengella sp. TaxID=2282762 RepID=UPI001D57AEA7|nr:OsmC family protein [Notoacmeibacter sp.]
MKRHATATWKGALADGTGAIDTQSGALSATAYSFRSRFEDEEGRAGTNPEELLAAAHAGCFAMQLSHLLAENGTPAERLQATATVAVERDDGGFSLRSSMLDLSARVPGIDESAFNELAAKAKDGCPVSRALGAISISLNAKLE